MRTPAFSRHRELRAVRGTLSSYRSSAFLNDSNHDRVQHEYSAAGIPEWNGVQATGKEYEQMKKVTKKKLTSMAALNGADGVRGMVKKSMKSYVDFTEQVADRMFGMGDRLMLAVKKTPLHSPLKYQQETSKKMFDAYLKTMQSLIGSL